MRKRIQGGLAAVIFSAPLAAQPVTVHATIDIARTGAPIDRRIYGQFAARRPVRVNVHWGGVPDHNSFEAPNAVHPVAFGSASEGGKLSFDLPPRAVAWWRSIEVQRRGFLRFIWAVSVKASSIRLVIATRAAAGSRAATAS